jgi:hypothetical protein
MEKVKTINLFRLSKRLEQNDSKPELFQQFEKNMYDLWDLLSKQEKVQIEEIHLKLKEKYSASFELEKKKLFGVSFK